MYTAVAIVMNL